MTPPAPLAQGNALQRAYARWAARHYARMDPALREQAEMIDRFLYSRRGLGVWLGLAVAVAASVLGLRGAGMPLALAVCISLMVWLALPMMLLAAWLVPDRVARPRPAGWLPRVLALGLAGALLGFVVGHVGKTGGLEPAALAEALFAKAGVLLPAALVGMAAVLAPMWLVARVRLELLQRAQAERRAAESRLKLLQAQVQPHFVFNTLAALQHWVDTGDARAPGLLRALTAFLRGSTELLGRDTVTLADEAEIVRQYLEIMQARLGERLRHAVSVVPDVASTRLPPGLLLTLVENAVEHGIAPGLAGGTVRLQAAREGGAVVVRVRDDGVGLAPQWQPGTGLANCRERLKLLGGTLELRPAEPGTEAVLTLPEAA